MAWYGNGTVSVTNNSTAVTGSGTAWVANGASGMGFQGPDRAIYEIDSINSDASLTLKRAYQGSSASGQAYALMPTQDYMRTLAASVSSLIASYSVIATNAGAGKFGDGTAAAPGITFGSNTNTGLYKYATNIIGVSMNGAVQAVWSTTGLAIGDTATDVKLRLKGANVANKGQLLIDASDFAQISMYNAATRKAALYMDTSQASAGDLILANYTADGRVVIGAGGGSEGLCLTKDRRVGIGNAAPSALLTVGSSAGGATAQVQVINATSSLVLGTSGGSFGGYAAGTVTTVFSLDSQPLAIFTNSAQPLLFGTGSQRWGMFDTSGNFLLGATSAANGSVKGIQVNSADLAGVFYSSGASGVGSGLHSRRDTNGNFAQFVYNSWTTQIGSISTSNGTQVAYNVSSDRRMKDNIAPAGDAGAVIAALEVVRYDWKSDGSEVRWGFVAQDLQAVFPDAVTPGDDGEDVAAAWGVDYSKLVPVLVKEVQVLRDRVAALEVAAQ